MELNKELLQQLIIFFSASMFIGFTVNSICEFVGYVAFKLLQLISDRYY